MGLLLLDDICFSLRVHEVVAQTIHLSVGYSTQTDRFFSRQKKGEDFKRKVSYFPYCLNILHTYDKGMLIHSIGIISFSTSIKKRGQMSLFEDID